MYNIGNSGNKMIDLVDQILFKGASSTPKATAQLKTVTS